MSRPPMGSKQNTRRGVLSSEHLEAYRRDGFVHLPAAFPREVALTLQSEIWDELEEVHGITRDRSTWRPPPRAPQRTKRSATNDGVASARLLGAIGDVLGGPDSTRPRDWGGFLVSFPAQEPSQGAAPGVELVSDAWHWDGHPDNGGLIVFTLYSTVERGGGGTRVLAGSHRLIAEFYASLSPADRERPHRDHRARLLGDGRAARFLQRATSAGHGPCRVVELLGEPGDAILCNPGLLHTASPNGTDSARFGRVKFLQWGGSGLSPR